MGERKTSASLKTDTLIFSGNFRVLKATCALFCHHKRPTERYGDASDANKKIDFVDVGNNLVSGDDKVTNVTTGEVLVQEPRNMDLTGIMQTACDPGKADFFDKYYAPDGESKFDLTENHSAQDTFENKFDY